MCACVWKVYNRTIFNLFTDSRDPSPRRANIAILGLLQGRPIACQDMQESPTTRVEEEGDTVRFDAFKEHTFA